MTDSYFHADGENITHFLIQVMVVVGVCAIVARIFAIVRQPSVIAQIVSGILLGPTILGRTDNFTDKLFAPSSMAIFNTIADFGLIWFMFLIGLELNQEMLMNNLKASAIISVTGVTIPFALGVGVAFFLKSLDYKDDDANMFHFCLFNGVAMAITAFPVLARVISERNLMGTQLGILILGSAAIDDLLAWIILSFIIALVRAGSGINALYVFVTVAAFFLFMHYIYRRLVNFVCARGMNDQRVFVFLLLSTLASSWFTEAVGIHAIFGAFVFGLIIPRGNRANILIAHKIEDYVVTLLLPLYFVKSGLRTNLGTLESGKDWGLTIFIVFIASIGKIVPGAVAARFCGRTWKEAGVVGSLRNAKGLVELIVLNIGLDLGVINVQVFGMLVFMAVMTTLSSTPLMYIIYPPHKIIADDEAKRLKLAGKRLETDVASIHGGHSGANGMSVLRAGNALSVLRNRTVLRNQAGATVLRMGNAQTLTRLQAAGGAAGGGTLGRNTGTLGRVGGTARVTAGGAENGRVSIMDFFDSGAPISNLPPPHAGGVGDNLNESARHPLLQESTTDDSVTSGNEATTTSAAAGAAADVEAGALGVGAVVKDLADDEYSDMLLELPPTFAVMYYMRDIEGHGLLNVGPIFNPMKGQTLQMVRVHEINELPSSFLDTHTAEGGSEESYTSPMTAGMSTVLSIRARLLNESVQASTITRPWYTDPSEQILKTVETMCAGIVFLGSSMAQKFPYLPLKILNESDVPVVGVLSLGGSLQLDDPVPVKRMVILYWNDNEDHQVLSCIEHIVGNAKDIKGLQTIILYASTIDAVSETRLKDLAATPAAGDSTVKLVRHDATTVPFRDAARHYGERSGGSPDLVVFGALLENAEKTKANKDKASARGGERINAQDVTTWFRPRLVVAMNVLDLHVIYTVPTLSNEVSTSTLV
eukprot:m.10201 g.10201  ORF g.10201 m.10201 type:complete len:932 (-) comp5154_c0_seq1:306-3101(-)